MGSAIELRGVHKTFGPKVAVRNLDLAVEEGALTGFIGPNGAGKTTTIRMIMSILFPDRGEVAVLGRRSAVESKDRIGYLPEERGLYKKMKVGPFLKFMARLKGVDAAGPNGGLEHKVRGWLEKVGLPDVYRKRCEELSKGMQQKVQFIASILHEPDLIILDEPFSGLDPVNSRLLRALIDEQHRQGRTIIFSTHQMSQAEALCDRVVMIHRGDKVLDDTPAAIRSVYDPRSILLEPALAGSGLDSLQAAALALRGIPGVDSAHVAGAGPPGTGGDSAGPSGRGNAGAGRFVTVHLAPGVGAATMLASLAAAVPCTRIEVIRPTLEDIFIGIVTGAGASDQERADLVASLRDAAKSDASGD